MSDDEDIVMIKKEEFEDMETALKFFELATYMLQWRITEHIDKSCVCEFCVSEFTRMIAEEDGEDFH